jgi:hypothetical protein
MKIRIFVGSGGIDPAARLKTALFMGTAGEHRRVPLESIEASGEFWVAQLDTAASLEQLAIVSPRPIS